MSTPSVVTRAAVIVAHPDDETLWAGGTILNRPGWSWWILALCRASDPDRAPKFRRVVQALGAEGAIADLDDGPEQSPLSAESVRDMIRTVVAGRSFDVVVTHGPRGEYTRHRRHEETCRAVAELWAVGGIEAKALWMFAFEDGGRAHLPRAIESASLVEPLSDTIWRRKQELITDVYGCDVASWEARVTPRTEAFYRFDRPDAATAWVEANGVEP
jgi:LmbE family N-acetylglucosaminyl deacetylase